MNTFATITYRSPACGEIFNDYTDAVLFLDTTALVSASKYEDFLEFLLQLSNSGCQLFTLPSAKYEFTRMAKSDTALRRYEDLLEELSVTIYPHLENRIDTPEVKQYLMLYNNCVNKACSQRKAPSFTDSLFCIILYLYRNSHTKVKLMTANYTDIPVQFFDREEMITIAAGSGVQVESIYSFNGVNFDRIYHSFKNKGNLKR